MRRKILAALSTFALAAVFTAAPARADDPQPAPNTPPGGFATWDALFAEQNKLTDALEAIRTAAGQAGDTGYASAVADPTTHALVLYWHGTPAPAVQQVITARRLIIPITVNPAPYTEAQLAAEAQRIGANSTAFYSAEPLANGSGVEVTWLAGQESQPLKAATVAGASVAVSFSAESAPGDAQPLSRQNDASPFSGGARTSNCTTAFAANHATGTKLLYVAHCGGLGSAVRDGAGDSMGTIGALYTSRDVGFISVLSKGAMWDGGPQSTFSKPVQDAVASTVGAYVCSSGSRSGVICGGQIKALNATVSGFSPLVRVETASHTAFGGQGDSGGPVFATGSGGKVRAVGIISRGSTATAATCVGEGGRSCFWRVYHADVRQTMALWGMSIRTTL